MFELDEFIEQNGLNEELIWDKNEIAEIKPILDSYVTNDISDVENAVVCGNPLELGEKLDCIQGFDNKYGAYGTCGLNSISNVCTIAGLDVPEYDVVEYAMENDLCEKVGPSALGGGVWANQTIKILEHYGIESHCELSEVATPDRVAELVEGGHGVIMGVNSGVLQDREWKVYNDQGEIETTHYVTITGTVRDAASGEIKGFYLCDSSSGRADGGAIYTPLEKIQAAYCDVNGGHIIASDKPIR